MRTFSEQVVLPDLRATAPDASITTRVLARVPALQPEGEDTPLVRMVRALLPPAQPGTHPTAEVVSYGTEGGQFQEAGIPTIVCGPGSIDVAHRPNEYLETDQLSRCSDFLRGLLTQCRSHGTLHSV